MLHEGQRVGDRFRGRDFAGPFSGVISDVRTTRSEFGSYVDVRVDVECWADACNSVIDTGTEIRTAHLFEPG